MLQINRDTQVIPIPGHDWVAGDVVIGRQRMVVPILRPPRSNSTCSGVRILDRYIISVSTAHCPSLAGGVSWTSPRPSDFDVDAGIEYLDSNDEFDLGLYRSSLSLPGRTIASEFPEEVGLYGWGVGDELRYARFRTLPDCDKPSSVRKVGRASEYTYVEDGDSGGPAIDRDGRICGLILGSKCGVVDLVDLTYPAVRQWLVAAGLPPEAFHNG